jgi:hypothetical protein
LHQACRKVWRKKTGQFFNREDLREIIYQVDDNEFAQTFRPKVWQDVVQDVRELPRWKDRIKFYKDNGALQDAWEKVYSSLRSNYQFIISQEVEEAKQMVAKDAMSELYGWTKDGEDMIKLSETKIQQHLQYYEQEIFDKSRNHLDELEESLDNSFDDL